MSMNNMFAIIDAATRGNFEKLTLHRMPGALPFSGRYRLIDFALSNIFNAGITNVAIYPFGNYRSLQDHVGSGKRWNLDRRKDGLFILPPKNMMMPSEDILTFQRMHEHLEYFKRSNQAYAIIMPAHLVWNADLNALLSEHIDHQAHISEVVQNQTRLGVFIIRKQELLEYINHYDVIPYKTLDDVYTKKTQIKTHTIAFDGYAKKITDPITYLEANLAMLTPETRKSIFEPSRPVLSKEKTMPPARYMKRPKIENAMVSSGSLIEGRIENSVIGRHVIVKKDAHIISSVIMSDAVIESGAFVKHAVIDKNVIVKQNTYIEGTSTQPFVTQKGQIITDQSDMKVLFAASEAHPYIKTGGLADVIGGLSKALSKKGLEITVILPLYKQIKERYHESYTYLKSTTFTFNGQTEKIRLYEIMRNKVRYVFIEHFSFFERDKLYGYEDDGLRFAFFSLAIKEALSIIGPFNLIHMHDWHVGLLPALLKTFEATPPKTLLTIHNIDYQGQFSVDILNALNLPLMGRSEVNFLEMGILEADKLSTVSPTYRNELKYEYYGQNLTHALQRRDRDFHGVLNGLPKRYTPQNDPVLLSKYSAQNIAPKTENKLFLQKQMHLSMGMSYFVIGMVSRITEQKGFPILIDSLYEVLKTHNDIQFVLLGTGDDGLTDRLKGLEEAFPNQVRLNLKYDATEPAYIYAGCDLFLMPSRVEPCGLAQMIALKYGAIPLVRKTGGLADTIQDYDPISKEGNGFTFYHYDPWVLKDRLFDAYDVFKNHKDDWYTLIKTAMHSDYSLETQAQKMLEIYLTTL